MTSPTDDFFQLVLALAVVLSSCRLVLPLTPGQSPVDRNQLQISDRQFYVFLQIIDILPNARFEITFLGSFDAACIYLKALENISVQSIHAGHLRRSARHGLRPMADGALSAPLLGHRLLLSCQRHQSIWQGQCRSPSQRPQLTSSCVQCFSRMSLNC